MRQKYDLISIGDVTIDAFIRLHEASVHCDLDNKNCQLCMSFADKIPYEDLTVVPAVGNSSNVAVGIRRLGLKSAAFNAIGADFHGRQILDVYKKEKVGSEFVKINRDKATNYHFVLNFRAERTILVKHQDFEYFDPAKIKSVPWIYFSSMGEHTLPFHHKLARYLVKNPHINVGFNPGTFQLKLGAKKLKDMYRHTNVLFVNREEAQRILGIKNPDPKVLFKGLHKLGPEIVVITDGPDGAYGSDGENAYYMRIYPDPGPPVSRTGAGDAFSSGFIGALMHGLPVTEALRWAPINSMNVVQHVGAHKGLLTRQQLLNLLKKAPNNYHPKKL